MSDGQADLCFVRDNFGHAPLITTSVYLHTEDDARHEATQTNHRLRWIRSRRKRPDNFLPHDLDHGLALPAAVRVQESIVLRLDFRSLADVRLNQSGE